MTEDYPGDWLADALSVWEAGRDAGREPTAQELCPGDPLKQERVQQAINRVKKVEGSPPVGPPPPPVPPGTPIVPGYEITGELGRGGMGVVYRARQLVLNREVALKLLLTDGTTNSKRLLAEAEAVARSEHPNVVRVHGTGEMNGLPFLALEFCDGGTLSERLKAGRMPPAEAVAVLQAVADGVAAAHARQVVHRDLKPGNVLFAGGVPKVADFGLAKFDTGPSLTPDHAIMGTPSYMAPEQAGGGTKFVGPPADVWAVGVMLYESMTGRRPFVADNIPALLSMIQSTEPQGVRSTAPGVPRELELIVAKCLMKEPADRYQSAAELADDLGRWRRGEPVSARPVPATVRAWKLLKRNPLPAGLAAAVLALVGVFGWSLVSRAQQKAQVATAEAQAATLDAENERQRATELDLRYRYFVQRGQLKDAAFVLDQNAQRSPEQRLDLAHVLYGLSQTERSMEQLRSVDPAALQPAQRGRWHLLNSQHLLADDLAGAKREIDSALRIRELPDADRRFAEGLLETSAPGALQKFQAAYAIDEKHLSARQMAMFTLIALGRLEELIALSHDTRLIYTDDAGAALLAALAHAMQGQEKEALALVRKIGSEYSKPQMDLLEAMVPLMGLVRYETAFPAASAAFNAAKSRWLSSGGPLRLSNSLRADAGSLVLPERLRIALPLPPAVRPTFDLWRRFGLFHLEPLRAAVASHNPFQLVAAMNAISERVTPDEWFADARAVADKNPEGFLLLVLALREDRLLFPPLDAPAADWIKARDKEAALAEQYEQAYRAPGRVFGGRVTACDLAIRHYTFGGMQVFKARLPPDEQRMTKAKTLLRERMASASWTRLPPIDSSDAVWVALHGGEPGWADQLLKSWNPAPHEQGMWYICRALADERLGAYHAALKAVEEARKHQAADPADELSAIVRRSKTALATTELTPTAGSAAK